MAKRIQALHWSRAKYVYVVYENGVKIGQYDSLDDAINSDPITIAYCPHCFVNADDCATKHAHMRDWKWEEVN